MTHTMIKTGKCGKCKKNKRKYKCTFCKEIFLTKREGNKHFKEVQHEWGGLEYID